MMRRTFLGPCGALLIAGAASADLPSQVPAPAVATSDKAPAGAASEDVDFTTMPAGARLDDPWKELKARDSDATFYDGGKAGFIKAPSAGSACIERPWPKGAQSIEVLMDSGDDKSGSGWAPCVAISVYGEISRFSLLPGIGKYDVDGVPAGSFDPSKPARLRIRMDGLDAICEAAQGDEPFQHIGTILCLKYPEVVRIGKVGANGTGVHAKSPENPVHCRVYKITWEMSAEALALQVSAKPFALLNPPEGITPANTREQFSRSTKPTLPRKTWTPEERKIYEARVKWFHDAKYGLFCCFLPGGKWTPEEWNAWVDAVDVEKFADQVKAVGAGYVILTIGQNQIYSCAPNPVIAKYWGEGYSSKRDLPMDLEKALEKRGISMMLYFPTDNSIPRPATLKGDELFDRWIEVFQWYSDHYGTKCRGWWVDGLKEFAKDFRVNIHNALKHGNPDALVASATYEISDFTHGHCMRAWNRQREVVKPYFGRWDADYKIQWQVLQHIGHTWGAPGSNKKTEDLVNYAVDVVRGGGVITFDIGTFKEGVFYNLPPDCKTGKKPDGTRIGPFLEIQPDQFKMLEAVRDALKDIKPSDGSGT